MAGIELADLIGELRTELAKARARSANDELQFEVGPVELELSIVVSREGGPSAKVKFFVVEVEAGAKLGEQATQRIKLTLTPQLGSGGKTYVHGTALKGEG
jgi:hypothetical protein